MQRLINSIVKHRKTVLVVFGVLLIIFAFLATRVRVNYNLQDYLPDDQPSVLAIDKLDEEFSMTLPNARVVFPVDSIREGLIGKQKLEETEGVTQVLWLDDSMDLAVPLEMADKKLTEIFYRDGMALYQVSADEAMAKDVLSRIYDLDPEVKVSGELVDLATAQTAVQSEMISITLVIIPIVLIILLLTTHAWLEPLIFMLAILVGIVLNMGSNIFLGEISFITQAVGAVIQLAVSMDYAIFMLNRFNENRQRGMEPEEAMEMAMRKAVTAISSSALTTVFGFLALIFMRFGIGADLGIVMAKGIVFSYLSVMIFMPCFLLMVYKGVDKTQHRSLLPDFGFMGRFVLKGRVPIIIIAVVLMIPSFLARQKNDFIYGMGGYPKGSRAAEDFDYIEDKFGRQTQISLLVPRGDILKEQEMEEAISAEPEVSNVIAYVNQGDPAIPPEVIDDSQLSMVLSDNYAQFVITADVGSEGDRSFALAQRLRDTAESYYGDEYYMTGANIAMLDMKETIEADDIVVNGLAVLAIAVVIGLAFQSLSLPIILVLTIETAIWINLSVPYFIGKKLSYIGYLIISTVQLGATVDYAILYTEHYMDNRKRLNKRQSVLQSSRETIPSLLPPALILTAAGISLYHTSSLKIVSELGEVLSRGAVFSLLMVVLVLPGALYFLDKVIEKTTRKTEFVPAFAPDLELPGKGSKHKRQRAELAPAKASDGNEEEEK